MTQTRVQQVCQRRSTFRKLVARWTPGKPPTLAGRPPVPGQAVLRGREHRSQLDGTAAVTVSAVRLIHGCCRPREWLIRSWYWIAVVTLPGSRQTNRIDPAQSRQQKSQKSRAPLWPGGRRPTSRPGLGAEGMCCHSATPLVHKYLLYFCVAYKTKTKQKLLCRRPRQNIWTPCQSVTTKMRYRPLLHCLVKAKAIV
jgi:hypothetical protein